MREMRMIAGLGIAVRKAGLGAARPALHRSISSHSISAALIHHRHFLVTSWRAASTIPAAAGEQSGAVYTTNLNAIAYAERAGGARELAGPAGIMWGRSSLEMIGDIVDIQKYRAGYAASNSAAGLRLSLACTRGIDHPHLAQVAKPPSQLGR